MFWSLHPGDQALIRHLDLGGNFPTAQGNDVLAVTAQNAANNKIDAYLHCSVADRVTDDPATDGWRPR